MLPSSFIASLRQIPGFHPVAFEKAHAAGEQVISVRINPSKYILLDDLAESFSMSAADFEKVPWSSEGLYISRRPSFTADPLMHAGAYYVQEASSMFLEQALRQTIDLKKPLNVLDLCAAPGGKSTLIQSLLSNDSLLVSNEVIKSRAAVLSENITKWGAANVVVTNNDPADFKRLENYFDVVVVDAPCSGSGLFRKDAAAIAEWSESNVQLCCQRQQRILADVFSSLKEDGVLIYSTCSYSKEEDEDINDWLTDHFPVSSLQLDTKKEWGITATISQKHKAYGYRFYPDKVKGEGFFIAAFRKNGEEKLEVKKKKNNLEKLSAKESAIINKYISDPAGFVFIKQKEEIIALPVTLEDELALLQSALYIRKAGVKLGTLIKNELVPHHELALSTIAHAAIPRIEVDKKNALQYLRKENMQLQHSHKGWVLITYRQLTLGWVKILSNRINNYYPSAWRILRK